MDEVIIANYKSQYTCIYMIFVTIALLNHILSMAKYVKFLVTYCLNDSSY